MIWTGALHPILAGQSLLFQEVFQHLRRLRPGCQSLGVQDSAVLAAHDAVLHGPPQGLQRPAAGLIRIGKMQFSTWLGGFGFRAILM